MTALWVWLSCQVPPKSRVPRWGIRKPQRQKPGYDSTCMLVYSERKKELCEKMKGNRWQLGLNWKSDLQEWWEGHEGEWCSTHHPEGSPLVHWSSINDPSISHSPPPPLLCLFLSPMLSLIDCGEEEPIAMILVLEKSMLIKMLLCVCVCVCVCVCEVCDC